MAGPKDNDHSLTGNSALAELPPAAKRSAQPNSPSASGDDPEDLDLQDQSRIIFGSSAVSGKAVLAGRSSAQIQEEITARKLADRKHREEAAAQEARELANLASWNKQYTTVGGVKMTNEEAQAARRRFIENEEYYSRRAVEMGYVKPEDVPALQRGMERQFELEDKVGRGIATDADKKALADWKASGLGNAGGKVTGDIHTGGGVALDASTVSAMSRNSFQRTASAVRTEDQFQSAPPVKTEFAARSEPIQVAAAPATPPTPSKKVEATGLDL